MKLSAQFGTRVVLIYYTEIQLFKRKIGTFHVYTTNCLNAQYLKGKSQLNQQLNRNESAL